MRRRVVLWLALALALLLVRPCASAVYDLGWTPPAVDSGRCWGDFCLIRVNSDGTGLEASWSEYDQPPPVVSNGPPIIP